MSNAAPSQQQLFETVVTILAEVQQQDGPSVAAQAAMANLRASVRFLLDAIGPQAARRALSSTVADLEAEIRQHNANSGAIQ